MPITDKPHRRYNPLTGEWVLVSPHRTQRPWQGAVEAVATENRPSYDPNCYLCPRNSRAGGSKNPDYRETFVFTNDFSALLPGPHEKEMDSGLFVSAPASGECRVICYSPHHNVSLANMEPEGIVKVVDLWAAQVEELGSKYRWIQIFENKGATMGASNPHPHGQIWCTDYLPTLPAREGEQQAAYFTARNRPLLLDILEQELVAKERVVVLNDHWALITPFWAVWPFEYLLIPRRHVKRLHDLDSAERTSLAEILKEGLRRYDALFQTSFPYSMGWHGAPTDGTEHPEWQLHAHFFPPLLRSSSVRKFMVGFEMLAEAQRDLTPEAAADRLRNV